MLIRLDKRIPVQAGLGGGSADAAATLAGLVQLWRVPVRPSQLTDVAATLGADVPFFLSGGTALGLGRATRCIRSPTCRGTGSCSSSLASACRSADAYSWYDERARPRPRAAAREPQHVPGPWPSRAAQMINDLEAPSPGTIPRSIR